MSIDRALTAPPLRSNSELSLVVTFCVLFELTRAEGRALVRLVKYDHATRQEIHIAIADGEPATGANIVDVVIGRLRRKLKSHDIEIATIYGLDFRLAADSRERIWRLLADYGEESSLQLRQRGLRNPRLHKETARWLEDQTGQTGKLN